MNVHKAIRFATIKHIDQKRKGTPYPYIIHPLEVMQILTEEGASEEIIIAGILHDTIEDTKTTHEELTTNFGEKVSQYVKYISENKELPWHDRKREAINTAKNSSKDVQLLFCADKLSNLRSIYYDLSNIGFELWDRFNSEICDIEWYYKNMIMALSELDGIRAYDELCALYNKVFEDNKIKNNFNKQ